MSTSDESGSVRRCANGHEVPDGNRFCGTCGAALSLPPTQISSSTPDTPTVPEKKRTSTGMLISGIGLVLVLVVGLLVILSHSRGDDASAGVASPSQPSSTAPLSAHQICYNQLFRASYNISNNVGNEMTINGVTDPFYEEAIQIAAQYSADATLNGKDAAQTKAEQAIHTWCRSQGDPKRKNVDEDGNEI